MPRAFTTPSTCWKESLRRDRSGSHVKTSARGADGPDAAHGYELSRTSQPTRSDLSWVATSVHHTLMVTRILSCRVVCSASVRAFCSVSTPLTFVSLEDGLRVEGACVEQLQVDAVLRLQEQLRAAAEDHGVYHDAVVVQQAEFCQGGRRLRAPGQQDVLTRARLALRDLLGEVLAEHAGAPGGLLQGAGEHELLGLPPVRGERTGVGIGRVRVRVRGRPVGGHYLPYRAAVQQCVDLLVHRVGVREQLRAHGGPVELAVRAGDVAVD